MLLTVVLRDLKDGLVSIPTIRVLLVIHDDGLTPLRSGQQSTSERATCVVGGSDQLADTRHGQHVSLRADIVSKMARGDLEQAVRALHWVASHRFTTGCGVGSKREYCESNTGCCADCRAFVVVTVEVTDKVGIVCYLLSIYAHFSLVHIASTSRENNKPNMSYRHVEFGDLGH